MSNDKIVVSRCLMGDGCRYDGKDQCVAYVKELVKQGRAIPICPEQLGGLSTPRQPSERVGTMVISRCGNDISEAFQTGAELALHIAQTHEARMAILKSLSPSCGKGQIYDGTFQGTLCSGNGVTTDLFLQAGIEVLNEEEGYEWYEKHQG